VPFNERLGPRKEPPSAGWNRVEAKFSAKNLGGTIEREILMKKSGRSFFRLHFFRKR